jgi:hypothetical protein
LGSSSSGVDETVRVNGRAVVVLDSALLSDHPLADRAAKVGLGVRVDEAFLHCAKAFKRSSL